MIDRMSVDHHNLDKNYIATLLIKYVMQFVKQKLGLEISYSKAWYSLKRTRENVYGIWESSVQKLPKFMRALQKSNEGTVVEWDHKYTRNPKQKIIKYVFWAFKPCIEGFHHCRKVISVDRTHLYTKYKHKMLIVVAMDGNQQVLPLPFAIVDEETTMYWKWFLQILSKHIIQWVEGMCLIFDRHPGILRAVESVPDFTLSRGVHRFCLRHVCSNFNNHFKNIQSRDLCYRAGTTYQIRKWAFAYDGGWRDGLLTTNMSECINGVLKGARRFPLTTIVDIKFHRCAQFFHKRVLKADRMMQNNQIWTDYAYRNISIGRHTHYIIL
ncbi:hypothetical protein Pfo_024453 [Paulownia fortunei]|nr:hypothetical protein Pfo_024453 [Paulownia fortunei]